MERVKEEVRKKIIEKVNLLIGQDGVTSFARSIGVSRDTVNNWISGKSDIRLNDLVKIREKYGVNIDYLLGLSDNPAISADVQIACKTTGLSNKAIENVCKCDSATLSALLENPGFCALIEDLVYVREAVFALGDCYSSIVNKTPLENDPSASPLVQATISQIDPEALTELRLADLLRLYDLVRSNKYELRDSFAAIIEKLDGASVIMSDVKKKLREHGMLSSFSTIQGGVNNVE